MFNSSEINEVEYLSGKKRCAPAWKVVFDFSTFVVVESRRATPGPSFLWCPLTAQPFITLRNQVSTVVRIDVLPPAQPPLGILILDPYGTRPLETVEQISLYTSSQQV